MQLKYAKTPETSHPEEEKPQCHGAGFENLGSAFRELGFCMMEVGLCLARICDKAIGGNELEQSLLESRAAKGRLIHYHSHLDAILLQQQLERGKANNKRGAKNIIKPLLQGSHSQCNSIARDAVHSDLWQQWHYDYGIFTILTAPFFHSETSNCKTQDPSPCVECPSSPTGHTSLQIYDPNKKRVIMVRAPPECFIVQVGESADIISKGKLRSTLHSVHRPSKFENLSRETFVVFLQPAWTKTFSVSDHHPLANSTFNGEQQSGQDDDDNNKLSLEIQKIVPPLASRLKDGMTFAEFSRETTKQYYGGSGLQSNR